jgi:hypothetical protein
MLRTQKGGRQTKVIAMLSEIFILRLETASRVLRKTLPLSPSSDSRFVPLDGNSQFAFKEASNSLNPEMGAVRGYEYFGYPY